MCLDQEKSTPALLINDDSLSLIKNKLPRITLHEIAASESNLKEKQRFVDFEQAFNYDCTGFSFKMLAYFYNLQNLFDLEFFACKLSSSSATMANVEKSVLTGVPFFEESDETLFADLNAEQSDTFNESGHVPINNKLAEAVAEKMAKEKS